MAFTLANATILRPLVAPNGKYPSDSNPKLWFYVSPDNTATTQTAGYFNGLAAYANVGDYIFADCTDGMHMLKVTANAAGVVSFGLRALS